MGDALSSDLNIRIMTGAQVLHDRTIPDVDYIATGSMGGLLAMQYLPSSCRKLVLISSTAKFCSTDNYPCGTHEKVLRRMMAQLQRDPEGVVDAFFKNVHYPFRESRQAIAMRRNASREIDDLVAGLEYLLQSDVREKVPNLDIPVLLLHGTEDRIIPSGAAEWLHAHLPNSQLKMIEGDGHALPAHHFESVVNAIRLFLGEQ